MGSYPIYIGGREAGTLRVERRGLMTVFEADCDMSPGLIRLSLRGEGGEGTLGLLTPSEGRLKLKKSLSREQLRGFPVQITHASPTGEAAAPASAKETLETADASEAPEAPSGEVPEEAEPESGDAPPGPPVEEAEEGSPTGRLWWPEPNPWSYFSDAALKAACREVRGALTSSDGDDELLALPVQNEFPPLPVKAPAEIRVISGARYAIVRIRGGRIDAG